LNTGYIGSPEQRLLLWDLQADRQEPLTLPGVADSTSSCGTPSGASGCSPRRGRRPASVRTAGGWGSGGTPPSSSGTWPTGGARRRPPGRARSTSARRSPRGRRPSCPGQIRGQVANPPPRSKGTALTPSPASPAAPGRRRRRTPGR
jgi:hypothetical protein